MELNKIIHLRAWCLLLILPPLLFPEITDPYTQIVFWTGIMLIGIPHGAIDHHIQLKSNALEWTRLLPFVMRYIAWMLVFLVFWLITPNGAILFFIAISAWHFGMVDFSHPKPIWIKITAWFYGMALLAFILLSHQSEVLPILEQLQIDSTWLSFFSSLGIEYQLIAANMLGLSIILTGRHQLWWTCGLLLIGSFLPLLLVFGLYFSFQHGLASAAETKAQLKVSLWRLVKMAAPFSLAAFALGLIIFFMLPYLQVDLLSLAPFAFLFLGMVTLPHVIYYQFTEP
jgi:Brp/Blh family beta-carotene 15,15'-monooxygenase